MDGIVGRDDERVVVGQFVAAAAAGPAALVVEGEAGIGKTALFQHAVGVAAAADVRVLRASPGEQEAQLTFSGLTDVLSPVGQDAIDALPPPQRAALAAATLREPGGAEPPDERAISTGLATLLNSLAAGGPLMVAVDDVQWLDLPSRRALAFALRRVAGPIGVLSCRRLPSVGPGLVDAMPEGSPIHRVDLGGLSVGATFVLVRERLGVALPRARLNRIWEVSQGNPLLVLELVRAAEHHLDEMLAGTLPLSERLEGLLTERLAVLSDAAAASCLAVACTGRATVELLRGSGFGPGLAEAESAGVLSVRQQRVSFTHPLLAAAALGRAPEPDRRRVHARLAALVDDPEQRARHFALADPAASAETAAALDRASAAAHQRGAISTAVELAGLAVERTPAGDVADSWRRRIAVATNLFAAGESVAAAEQLADRAIACPPGRLRAEAELLMTEIEYTMSTAAAATAAAQTALAHADDDPRLRARALLSLTVVDTQHRDSIARAREALRALEALDPPDQSTMAWAMIVDAGGRILAGEPVDPDELHAAAALERRGRLWRSTDNASATRPVHLRWLGEAEAGLAALAELEQRAEQEGNEGTIPYVLGHRASCLLMLARFREAGETAGRHLAHAEATGQDGQRVQALYLLACAHAYLGELELARDEAAEAFAAAAEWGDPWLLTGATGIYGVAELALGQPATARELLDRWQAEARRAGVAGPKMAPFYVDHVEALLACRDRDAAVAVTDELVAVADRACRRWAQAASRHCLGLLAADEGDLGGALDQLDVALTFDAKDLNAFARGRVLVLKGVVHRRRREKAAARTALEGASALFESVGSVHWSGVVDAELARLGRRTGDRFALTETERRVAELAAGGLTNREVAERAFISPKTVEANLGRVYRKLGIRSRAELGARMSGGGAPVET